MQKMGVLISPRTVEVKNVAAVFITASLPPFARPGARLDVTVSSVGDAQSLEGGVLLMSALHGPDGQVYAEAQGPLVMGGYSAGNGAEREGSEFSQRRHHSQRRHRGTRHVGGSAAISRPCRCCCAIPTSRPPRRLPTPSTRSFTNRSLRSRQQPRRRQRRRRRRSHSVTAPDLAGAESGRSAFTPRPRSSSTSAPEPSCWAATSSSRRSR